jgi:hypothetical protein
MADRDGRRTSLACDIFVPEGVAARGLEAINKLWNSAAAFQLGLHKGAP